MTLDLVIADLRQGRRLGESCRTHGLVAADVPAGPRWAEIAAAAAEGLDDLHTRLDVIDPPWSSRPPSTIGAPR